MVKKKQGCSGCLTAPVKVVAGLFRLLGVIVSAIVQGIINIFSFLSRTKISIGERRVSCLALLAASAAILVALGCLANLAIVAVYQIDLSLREAGFLPTYTPTSTPTFTPTSTPTSTPTNTPTITPTPLPTNTPTVTPTPLPTNTSTPTVTPTSVPMGFATTDVNLRSGPGTNYARIGSLQEDEKVQILGITSSGDWYRIKASDAHIAWVSADYVDTSSSPEAIPTISRGDIPSTPMPTNTPRPPPTATLIPLPTNTPRPVCDCGGDYYNCGNFSSKSQARSCYRYCVSIGRGDVHNLDGDGDGVACE